MTLIDIFVLEILESVPPEANMVQYVIYVLASEEIEGLPPGGGIHAKLVDSGCI